MSEEARFLICLTLSIILVGLTGYCLIVNPMLIATIIASLCVFAITITAVLALTYALTELWEAFIGD